MNSPEIITIGFVWDLDQSDLTEDVICSLGPHLNLSGVRMTTAQYNLNNAPFWSFMILMDSTLVCLAPSSHIIVIIFKDCSDWIVDRNIQSTSVLSPVHLSRTCQRTCQRKIVRCGRTFPYKIRISYSKTHYNLCLSACIKQIRFD